MHEAVILNAVRIEFEPNIVIGIGETLADLNTQLHCLKITIKITPKLDQSSESQK